MNIFLNGVNDNKKCSNRIHRIMKQLQWRQAQIHSTSYVLSLDDDTTITVKQILNGEMKGIGTGSFVWPAAVVLAKYLENEYCTCDKRVIDIGSGTGITGIVAAYLGSKEVVLTDQSQLLPLLQENVSTFNHQSKSNIKVKEYEWGCNIDHLNAPFDIVLVSDCVLPKLYPIEPLIAAVKNVMNNQSIAIFSYEHRTYPLFDPRDEFRRICSLYGLRCKVIPLSKHHKNYNCDDIELWEVRANIDEANIDEDNYLSILELNNEYTVTVMNKLIQLKKGNNDSFMDSLWPSSVVLSRFILKNGITGYKKHEDNRAKQICLELGSGLGIVTMALLQRNFYVIATDKEALIPTLEYNLKQFSNANENSTLSSYKVEPLDWSSFEMKQELKEKVLNNRMPDYIICSDCVYSTGTIKPLLDTINYLSGKDTVLIMANELRTALDEFILLAKKNKENPRTVIDIEISEDDRVSYTSNLGSYANRPVRLLTSTITI